MRWYTIISYRGTPLQDARQLELAQAALIAHFGDAGCTPSQAARAVFDQERPLNIADDGQTVFDAGDPEVNGAWANAWREAPEVVAQALSLPEADVAVELQFEQAPARSGTFDPTTARRLFIGLMVSQVTRHEIAAYQMEWHWTSAARLVPPDHFHLTLAFLGNVDRQDEHRLRSLLADVKVAPLSLQLVAGTTLGQDIAVLSPATNLDLGDLRANVLASIRRLDLPVDTKPWLPHVTLARSAQGCRPPTQAPFIEMTISQFSLVSSRVDGSSGYEVLGSWGE